MCVDQITSILISFQCEVDDVFSTCHVITVRAADRRVTVGRNVQLLGPSGDLAPVIGSSRASSSDWIFHSSGEGTALLPGQNPARVTSVMHRDIGYNLWHRPRELAVPWRTPEPLEWTQDPEPT